MTFEERLDRTLAQLEPKRPFPDNFYRTYRFPTENVSGYLKYFELNNKSLLTVGSSGAQVINSFYFGARDITLLDINENAKDYVWLVIASILSLTYLEFQKFFYIHGYDIGEDYYNKKYFDKALFNNKIKDTLRILDYEAYMYYDEIFNNFDKKRIQDYLMDDDECSPKAIRGFNVYLKNELNYNRLKNIIKKISFKFINVDIYNANINRKYDNIFLSNLCTLTRINKLKTLVEKLAKENLNINGSILFAYLFNTNFNENEYESNWQEIYNMEKTKEDFKKYISEYHQIKGRRNFVHNNDEQDDLILIYRKTKNDLL